LSLLVPGEVQALLELRRGLVEAVLLLGHALLQHVHLAVLALQLHLQQLTPAKSKTNERVKETD